jgi:hypothetical protein
VARAPGRAARIPAARIPPPASAPRRPLAPGAPFGGVKASGIGRELGPNAIGAYQQLKSIYA